MKHTGQLHRKTRLRRHGLRHLRDAQAREAFRVAVLQRARGRCERCGSDSRLEAHHLVARARAPGWSGLHEPSNGAALCVPCHRAVTDRVARDWSRWVLKAPAVEA